MRDQLKIADIKAALQAQCPGLIFQLVPRVRREGGIYCAPNPTRAHDTYGSFKIRRNGGFTEYDSGDKGDILDLISYVHGRGTGTKDARAFALEWAKSHLGLAQVDPEKLQKIKAQTEQRARESALEEAKREAFIAQRVQDIIAKAHKCDPSGDEAVMRYLRGRGLDPAAVRNRCMPLLQADDLKHWTHEWKGPALISPVMQPDGRKAGVHVVFIDPETFGKAPVPTPKLMLGTVKGGVVPLTYGEHNLSLQESAAAGKQCPVILCEGRETGEALAAAVPEARVWCCLSLSNMANAPVNHPAISAVILAIENDVKPQALKQREKVIETLEGFGKPVIPMKPHMGSDFADVMKG
jgi:hypothetical protein